MENRLNCAKMVESHDSHVIMHGVILSRFFCIIPIYPAIHQRDFLWRYLKQTETKQFGSKVQFTEYKIEGTNRKGWKHVGAVQIMVQINLNFRTFREAKYSISFEVWLAFGHKTNLPLTPTLLSWEQQLEQSCLQKLCMFKRAL